AKAARLSIGLGRRTLRRLGQSAAWLAIVTAARLTERDAEPEIAARDDEAARQRDVRLGEVTDGSDEVAAAVRMHLRTIGRVSEDGKPIHTPHGDLTLEEIAEMLPGTGEIMQNVGVTWWKCAYAARGGNWGLAAYFARRTRTLQRKLAIVRPKYAGDVAAFEATHLAAVLGACEREDRAAFDAAYETAVAAANELHVKWGKPYIR